MSCCIFLEVATNRLKLTQHGIQHDTRQHIDKIRSFYLAKCWYLKRININPFVCLRPYIRNYKLSKFPLPLEYPHTGSRTNVAPRNWGVCGWTDRNESQRTTNASPKAHTSTREIKLNPWPSLTFDNCYTKACMMNVNSHEPQSLTKTLKYFMCNIRINELAIDLFEKWYHLIILLYVSKLALLASFNLSAFNSKESLVHTMYITRLVRLI